MIVLALMGCWAAALCGVAALRPGWLLPAVILCAPFEAAALAMVGGVGVSPFWFLLVLVAARCGMVRTTRATAMGRSPQLQRIVGLTAGLLAVGLAGAVVLPRVFAGTVVIAPRLDADATARLVFSTGNVAQAAYLTLAAAMIWFGAQAADAVVTLRRVVGCVRWIGVFVVALALYQFGAALTGLPFPDDFFYSNTAYVMQSNTAILDMPRLCSTFTEPSAMALYLVGYLAFLVAEPPSPRRAGLVFRGVMVVLTIAVLALSTSSTAYVGLAGIAVWAMLQYVVWPMVHGRPHPLAVAAVTAVLAMSGVAFASSDILRQVVQKMVFEKGDSSSYDDRHEADLLATGLVKSTWGLGVGLGSNRASSFGPSLLSTVGVAGAAALGGVLFHLLRPPPKTTDPSVRQWHAPLAANLIGIVTTKMISSPDLTTPTLWSAMAALLCVHAAAAEQRVVAPDVLVECRPEPVRAGRRARAAVGVGKGSVTA